MNFREMPESIVIVRNKDGAVATLRYKNRKLDKIISSPSAQKSTIYKIIESHVTGKDFSGKKER